MKILIINGPNLDMLGKRDRNIYGAFTPNDLNNYIKDYCIKLSIDTEFFQSSYEGAIIDKLHQCSVDGIILNAGAYTHYSYAIRDAIECTSIPVVEVHISDISVREPFRRISVIKDVCAATFMGKGKDSYLMAVDYLIKNPQKLVKL
jgi:3-dehydroquinate dehydratase-2